MVRVEDAIRLAAEHGAATADVAPTTTTADDHVAAVEPAIAGAAATQAEAVRALRMSREAAPTAGLIPLRHGFWSRPGSMELITLEPEPAEDGPRRAQGP